MASSSLYQEVDEIVPDTWKSLVPTIVGQPNAASFVGKNRDAGGDGKSPTLPVRELTFRALFPYAPEDWNVIIFGQNPYPRIESATGIAMFDGQYKNWQGTMSPSLRNIIKNAVMTELPSKANKSTKIDELRKVLAAEKVVQPVQWFESSLASRCLWLNTALTTGGNNSDPAHNKFWKPIVEDIVRQILAAKHEGGKGKGIVVALWGNQAAKLRKMVSSINTFGVPVEFVESYNPAAQGDIFCNSSVFKEINDALSKLDLEAIDWLPRVNGKRKTVGSTTGASSSENGKKGKKVAAAADDDDEEKEEEEEEDGETARISAFMESTIQLHQMLVDRIKDVKMESSLKKTGLLDGLDQVKLVSFRDALAATSTSQAIIDRAYHFAEHHPSSMASIDQVAALHLYTMGSSFYGTLNKCLRDAIPEKVKPFFSYLRLFLDAMESVQQATSSSSSSSSHTSLWRGVDVDLSPEYKKGTTITWWGVSSCTTTKSVALGFMGGSGTLFQIQTVKGISVKAFSAFQGEDEVVLAPGTALRVVNSVKKGSVCTITLATS